MLLFRVSAVLVPDLCRARSLLFRISAVLGASAMHVCCCSGSLRCKFVAVSDLCGARLLLFRISVPLSTSSSWSSYHCRHHRDHRAPGYATSAPVSWWYDQRNTKQHSNGSMIRRRATISRTIFCSAGRSGRPQTTLNVHIPGRSENDVLGYYFSMSIQR